MKKFLTVSALIYFTINFIDTLLFDLMPAINSNEPIAYKSGFVFAFLITAILAIGFAIWAYQIFSPQKEFQST